MSSWMAGSRHWYLQLLRWEIAAEIYECTLIFSWQLCVSLAVCNVPVLASVIFPLRQPQSIHMSSIRFQKWEDSHGQSFSESSTRNKHDCLGVTSDTSTVLRTIDHSATISESSFSSNRDHETRKTTGLTLEIWCLYCCIIKYLLLLMEYHILRYKIPRTKGSLVPEAWR